jgi:hypothetical protein
MVSAFLYVADHGIDTNENYPYKARNQKCDHNGGEFKLKKHTELPANCEALAKAVS